MQNAGIRHALNLSILNHMSVTLTLSSVISSILNPIILNMLYFLRFCDANMGMPAAILCLYFSIILEMYFMAVFILDESFTTYFVNLTPDGITVAHICIVLAQWWKLSCYTSSLKELGQHISCPFIIPCTALNILQLYASWAHFWYWRGCLVINMYSHSVYNRVALVGIAVHINHVLIFGKCLVYFC